MIRKMLVTWFREKNMGFCVRGAQFKTSVCGGGGVHAPERDSLYGKFLANISILEQY